MDARNKADRRILIIFFTFAILSLVLPLALSPLFEGATATDIVSRTISGLSLSLLLAGVSAYFNYRKSGLMPRRTLLKWVAVVSVVVSLISSVVVTLVIWSNPSDFEMPDISSGPLDQHLPAVFLELFVVQIPTFFITALSLMLLGFGIVGVMAALERRLTPHILRVITGLSEKPKLSIFEMAIRWLFDIPEVLDTKKLDLNPAQPRTRVTLRDMRWPIAWQLFFGAVLAVYVSFNPFLSHTSPDELFSLFTILTAISLLIPLLILPWFIYLRIGAHIQGQAKDFTLFRGIRARIFQSYVAVGTLIIIVRLSISDIDIATFVLGFSTFMMTLLLVAVMCTFLYMNNFENGLAEDIVSKFRGKDAGKTEEPPSSADR